MADTIRNKTDLLALLPIGTPGAISSQDMRDILVSVLGVYGSIVIEAGVTAQTFALGVAEVMTEWTGNGISSGITPDEANNQITVIHTGDYLADFFVSFTGNVGINNEFELRVDGVATGIQCQFDTSGTDMVSTGFSRPISLTAAENVSIWITGDAASNLTAVHAGLTLRRIG